MFKNKAMSNSDVLHLKALRRIVRPLLRVLISRGITLPTLVQVVKQVYVEAAQDFTIPGKSMTDSRISLITGLHRRDVKSIREALEAEVPSKPHLPIGARVVSIWTGETKYLTEAGEPKALPKHGEDSFDEIVASINKDFRSRTLLDEWLSKGIVSYTLDNLLQLHVEAFVPSDDEQEMLAFFGANLGDHMATAAHNLMNPQARILERAAYQNGLTQKSIAQLESSSQQAGMQLLVEVNKQAIALAQQDADVDEVKYQYRFGTYFYHSGMETVTPDSEKMT